VDDLRDFLKGQNIYPTEKNLALLFERLDRNEDQVVDFDEFVATITPFLQNVH
jgi:Ca2+-binding EF-hand superfamily protein